MKGFLPLRHLDVSRRLLPSILLWLCFDLFFFLRGFFLPTTDRIFTRISASSVQIGLVSVLQP